MKVCIHRGTKQIGGTCIEVEAQGKRIVLDVGLPLDADETTDVGKLLPPVPGFREDDDSLLGVIISHPHMDHYGLTRFIRPGLPIYIGEKANAILKAASDYVPDGTFIENAVYYEDHKPTKIGPFTITPFLADHSAFDAYSLLIEADGKRVFYSGDFRGHGRKAHLFERMIKNPPSNIDVLMMEGTNISEEGQKKVTQKEKELEKRFVEDIEQTKGIYLAYLSAQNIDRVVTLFRAAKKTGRSLLIDLYAAAILEATDTDSIPKSTWKEVKVFVPYMQWRQVDEGKLPDNLKRLHPDRIYTKHLTKTPSQYVMLMRPWMSRDLDFAKCTDGARCAYSMWSGYLKDDNLIRFQAWLDKRGIPMTQIHTSGHAPVEDLKKFAEAMAPKRLIPIHSFETDKFVDHFSNVETKDDGDWWEV